jgi:hypothetical protein
MRSINETPIKFSAGETLNLRYSMEMHMAVMWLPRLACRKVSIVRLLYLQGQLYKMLDAPVPRASNSHPVLQSASKPLFQTPIARTDPTPLHVQLLTYSYSNSPMAHPSCQSSHDLVSPLRIPLPPHWTLLIANHHSSQPYYLPTYIPS